MILFKKIPRIKISADTLEYENIIGEIYSINKHNNKGVQDLLNIENKEYIQLDYHPINIKILSNNRLLVLNYLNDDKDDLTQCITIHDENYKLIKKEDEINGESFSHIEEIAINEDERELYLLDFNNDRIIVTDFELNFIKYFGSRGDKNNQFNYPRGICFKNENLYVSDRLNQRIQMFNQDFEFIKSLELEYEPREIQTSNSMLAVTSDNGINFYDLNSLEFHVKFDYELNFGLFLSEIDSIFYGFDYTTRDVFCFDSNGKLIEKIHVNLRDEISLLTGRLVIFNKCLLMNSYESEKLIKFK